MSKTLILWWPNYTVQKRIQVDLFKAWTWSSVKRILDYWVIFNYYIYVFLFSASIILWLQIKIHMYIISKIYIKNAVKLMKVILESRDYLLMIHKWLEFQSWGKKLKSSNMKLMLVNLNFYNLLCIGHPAILAIMKINQIPNVIRVISGF